MSTDKAPTVPYVRMVAILCTAVIAAFWFSGELLKISIFLLAVCAGLTVIEIERVLQYCRQKPKGIEYLRSITYRYLDFFAGTAQDYRAFFAGDCDKPERIVHAANRVKSSGRIYSVAAPGRHHNVEAMMRQVGIPNSDDIEQGFVSSRGRYLNRKEALVVATLANQLIRKTPPEDRLFSEDVWDPAVFTHQQLKDKADELIAKAIGSEAMVTINLVRAIPDLEFDGNVKMQSGVQDSYEKTKRLAARRTKARTPAT